jgi:hypothetical protein
MPLPRLASLSKRYLRLAFIFTLAAAFTWSAQAATSYSFTLPSGATTSAGVYKPDGTLVRTLWSKVYYSSGTHASSAGTAPLHWDDKDDNGNTMPAGTYQIRVLFHNVTYTWEGVIGNTSSSFNGPSVHFNFLPITAMAFTGASGYYCSGYNEAHYEFTEFDPSDPQATTGHFGEYYDYRFNLTYDRPADIYCRDWALAVADATHVYFASPNGFDTATNSNYGQPGFVTKYTISNNSTAAFTTAGQNIASGPHNTTGWGDAHQYRVYPGALKVGTQPGLSGLAVQAGGTLLAVSVAPDDTVYLFNKTTGASAGTITVTGAQGLAFAPNGDLWVISGTTVKRYTSVGTSNTLAHTISGFSAPLAVAVHPSNNDLVLVTDGGASQQIKGYTATGAAATNWSTPLGLAGGHTSNGPAIANNKFWFRDIYGGSGTFLAFQPDGSFWLGDMGNARALHFSAAQAYLNQIAYRPNENVMTADMNAPTRIFSKWMEYEVDYTQTLNPGDPTAPGGNNSWKLIRNWGHGVAATYDQFWLGGLQSVVTLNNGRTWGMVNRTDHQREIVELQSGGLHFTGILFSNSASIYHNGEIRDYTKSGGIATITRRSVSFDSAGTPTWAAATTLATAPAGATDPFYHGGYTGANGPRFPFTSSGVTISLDSSAGGASGNLGMHLGGVAKGASQWLWAASPGYLTGGVYGDGPDGLGSYSTDADSFGGWAGSTAWTNGRNVVYGYNGQWSHYSNQFMHFWDNGLFVGQFGVSGDVGTVDYPDAGPVAGFASNAFSPVMVRNGSALYVYQTDEMVHSGLHRWRIDGMDDVAEVVGSGALGGSITVNQQTTTVLSVDFESAVGGTFTRVTSTGDTQSPGGTPPDASLHVGRIDGLNTYATYHLASLASGDVLAVSLDANNDNAGGDPRGMILTLFTMLSNGTVSRRFDVTTGSNQTWQQLAKTVTLTAGETNCWIYVGTGFGQNKGFADNLKATVTR